MNRIVSLIASSTETICALGYRDSLVGRSHECDYPPSVLSLPACSEAKFDLEGASKEIDERVRKTLATEQSVYRTHVDLLQKLDPTLIVTQDHCEICAVVLKDVEQAVREDLEGRPEIVSLAPSSLEGIFDGMIEIASALGDAEKGRLMVAWLKQRMDRAWRIRSKS